MNSSSNATLARLATEICQEPSGRYSTPTRSQAHRNKPWMSIDRFEKEYRGYSYRFPRTTAKFVMRRPFGLSWCGGWDSNPHVLSDNGF